MVRMIFRKQRACIIGFWVSLFGFGKGVLEGRLLLFGTPFKFIFVENLKVDLHCNGGKGPRKCVKCNMTRHNWRKGTRNRVECRIPRRKQQKGT